MIAAIGGQVAGVTGGWNGVGNVTFAPADATHPPTVTISADTVVTGSAATTTPTTNGETINNTTNPATIVFHANGGKNGVPAYSSTAANYGVTFLQDALHEIGHIMGLGDFNPSAYPPPSSTTSVMEPHIGTNDVGNTSPKSGPTDCDKIQAVAQTAFYASLSAAGDDGSSNAGGVGDQSTDVDDENTTYIDGTGTTTITEGNIQATLNTDGSSEIVNTTTVTVIDNDGNQTVTVTTATTEVAADGSSVTTVTESVNGATPTVIGTLTTPAPSGDSPCEH